MILAGIDAGSRAIKIVLIDKDRNIIAQGSHDQGIHQEEITNQLLNMLLEEKGYSRKDLAKITATGYGRDLISFADKTISEITCHAKGVHHLVPNVRTVIDIGGQDSKLIKLDANGSIEDFIMNDRCAAGTGCFLEVVANRLGVNLETLAKMASQSSNPAVISSMCVVFAETEIIGLLASGTEPKDIVAGVQKSIASRIKSMAGRNINTPIIFTGGVAMIPSMVNALESVLAKPIAIAPQPQFTGALGAAILAAELSKNF